MSRSLVLVLACSAAGLLQADNVSLSNGVLKAEFNDRGLVALGDVHFQKDEFAMVLSGRTFDSAKLATPSRKAGEERVVYSYTAGPYRIDAVYELRPGWRFVGKRLVIASAPAGKFRIDEVTVFRGAVAEPVRDTYILKRGRKDLGTGDYAGFLHFDDTHGLFAAVQNPFLAVEAEAAAFTISYKPDMDWSMEWGPFEADRGLLAPYRLTGRRQPERMLPEWRMGPQEAPPGLDEGEVAVFTDCVRSLLLYKPEKPLRLVVGWCLNDYQIDISTPAGRAEYKRIIDSAASLGIANLLFAPTNSDVSLRDESSDDWGWENLLWLGMGEKIRRNEWNPATGRIADSIQEMIDYGRSKGVKFVAYVYPVLGFEQDKGWLLGARGRRANLGVRNFQDWLIGALESFYKHTGIGGYSFDHTFLGYEGASRYAQWWGWRRVMETLRRDIPDIIIDGRQAYQLYGPWTWLAGSYPHPTGTDEQPESFVSFPDLKFDRVSADRERYTAFRYRQYEFAPSEIVPGFITHQTGRNDDTGRMPEARGPRDTVLLPFRRRDWDYLGWRYSLLSSIAVAGWNNVVDMIPARDVAEYGNFSETDKQWFRRWLDWCDANREYLRRTRPIMGQPALGKTDGTSMLVDGRGYLFLFNPNGRRLPAEFTLDAAIGLDREGRYLLKEIYPLEGRLVGKPGAGVWSSGDRVSIVMDGGSAVVLSLEPAPDAVREPLLFNAPGRASLAGGVLSIVGVRGEVGTSEELIVVVPRGAPVSSVKVNGGAAKFTRSADLLSVAVTFAGEPFRHYQQIGAYDPSFTGGTVRASFRIPQRVFDQLAARRQAWPIPWTSEDMRATWLAPQRLLLYLQLAEPDEKWTPRLKLNGRPVDLLKAYASIRANPRNFLGFYADLSLLESDKEYKVELDLPPLKPGQFQGLFFENIEPEYTEAIKAPR
jgi:hypothetical protein